MAVFRVEKNSGYTVMSNHHLRNRALSLKAKGLLSQMLSLPEDWDYTLQGLARINRESIDAIRQAIRELEQAGYIQRSRERDEKGRLRGADYVIFELPQPVPASVSPTLENPTLENPTQENPTLENPMQLNLDEIEHDPYVLISILSALHDGVFTLAEVQGELEMLFEKQYILTETVTMQIRYRTKMMVIIGPYGVPQVITYQEPYEYYICTVKLKNKDLSHLPVEVLTEEQLSAYSLYMRTLGNRPDLFGQAQYPNASTIKQPTYYDIPPEALKDDKFAAMMEEATKYIGYPYVWGGSSPSTSFDCSGYISWVLNHSGWNVGRQTAQGLYNLCTPVSTAQVKPGDLVFFKGTYDTPGVSHCGIYVGNSIMLHCGDPISYTNLNSKYWQEHFYSYGRLP